MSEWLDLSNNANCFKSMYIDGFLDLSGGSFQTRGPSDHLMIGGDVSLNGQTYLGGKLLVGTDGYVAEGTADNGATTYDICGNALNGATSYDVSGTADNGAAIISVTIPADASWSLIGDEIDGTAHSDKSGSSVSLSSDGTIMAIGAPETYFGRVRVYQYANSAWSQLGGDINGEAKDDFSGVSVSLSSDGTIVAIGANGNDGTGLSAAGNVRVYQYDASKTTSSTSSSNYGPVGWRRLGADIDGEASNESSGTSVSLSSDGTIVAIGAPGTYFRRVRVYQYANSVWSQLGGNIDGEAYFDKSGTSVSLSSDGLTVAIGAYLNDGTDATDSRRGHVRVYQYDASKTTAETEQSSPDFGPVGWRRLGADIDGEAANDYSGWSVSLSSDGTIVAIGAYYNNGTTGTDSGHVRVYQYNGSAWSQLGGDIDGESSYDFSGYSMSLSSDGTIVAIGAYQNYTNGLHDVGHVRVYQYDASKKTASTNSSNYGPVGWTRLGADIDGANRDDQSGYSVSLSSDGTIVAIGAPYNDGTSQYINDTRQGHVRVYEITNTKSYADVSGGYHDTIAYNRDGLTTNAATIHGTTDISGALLVAGDVSFNAGNLFVGGDCSINGALSFGSLGNKVSSGDIDFSSDLSLNHKLFVGTNDLSYNGIIGYNYSESTNNQLGGDIDGEAAGDKSGYSVSLSSDGTIVAIGAQYNNGTYGSNAGHVRVYQYRTLTEASFTDISNNTNINYGGIVGPTVDGTWASDKKFWVQMGYDIDGEKSSDYSGSSVSLSSDGLTVAIGAYGNDGTGLSDSGHVRVYQYNDVSWSQLGSDIDGEATYDNSGESVSLSSDGTIVAIGAPSNDGTDGTDTKRGHVRVYQYDGSAWSQLGADIDGEAAYDQQFQPQMSVSLSSDGTIVAIGAYRNDGTDGTDSNRGHVRVYQYRTVSSDEWTDTYNTTDMSYNGTTYNKPILMSGGDATWTENKYYWVQIGADIDGEAAGDKSGDAVSLSSDGTIVAIGANWNNDNGSSSGHVRVYQYDGSAWTKLGADIDGERSSDYSGNSVSLSSDGTVVAIGANSNRDNGTSSGHVRVYQYRTVASLTEWNAYNTSSTLYKEGTTNNKPVLMSGGDATWTENKYYWVQSGRDIDGEAKSDQSGHSVSLSSDGTVVAIGSYWNDGNRGHVRVYQTITNPIYQTIHGDLSYNAAADPSFNFAAHVSLNSALTVPGNILVVDGSANNYGAYTTYSNQAGTASFSVGKSASNVFNIVDQDNAGVYMASGGTTLTSTSDIRLKTDIVALESATEKIMALKPCTYKWKTEEGKDVRPHPGFIAQETKEALPEVVHKIDHPDGDDYLGVNTTDMIPYLIKMIQGQVIQITKLQEKINSHVAKKK